MQRRHGGGPGRGHSGQRVGRSMPKVYARGLTELFARNWGVSAHARGDSPVRRRTPLATRRPAASPVAGGRRRCGPGPRPAGEGPASGRTPSPSRRGQPTVAIDVGRYFRPAVMMAAAVSLDGELPRRVRDVHPCDEQPARAADLVLNDRHRKLLRREDPQQPALEHTLGRARFCVALVQCPAEHSRASRSGPPHPIQRLGHPRKAEIAPRGGVQTVLDGAGRCDQAQIGEGARHGGDPNAIHDQHIGRLQPDGLVHDDAGQPRQPYATRHCDLDPAETGAVQAVELGCRPVRRRPRSLAPPSWRSSVADATSSALQRPRARSASGSSARPTPGRCATSTRSLRRPSLGAATTRRAGSALRPAAGRGFAHADGVCLTHPRPELGSLDTPRARTLPSSRVGNLSSGSARACTGRRARRRGTRPARR